MYKNILAINWGGGRDGGFEDMEFQGVLKK